jgi:hypothetical protein
MFDMERMNEIEAMAKELKQIRGRFVFKKYFWLFMISAISVAALLSLNPAQAANYYVREYGAVGDGSTNDQAAIQDAIDDAAAHGGGDVIFDGGRTYYTGNLFMRSNITLVIESGSRIKASNYATDYDPNRCSDGTCGNVAPLIFADNLQNIGIRGGGTIEGARNNFVCPNGQQCEWDDHSFGPTMIFWGDVSNGTIREIHVENANNAELVIAECDHILVENITLRTPTDHAANDPFDIFGSQFITIRNNDIAGGDDNICLKIRSPYSGFMMTDYNEEVMHDITIEGNTVYAPYAGTGLKTGWEVYGEIYNVWWRDNVVRRGTVDPISIWLRFLDEENTSIHHMYFENNRYDDGQLVEGLSINGPIKDCQYYEIYWNGELAKYSDTAAQCGGTTCSCTAWEDQACGGGGCAEGEMLQTRTCSPSSCNSESRCVSNPICSVNVDDGDINQDGSVDTIDIQVGVNVILGIETDPSLTQQSDMNNDGVVDETDLNLVLTEIFN